MMYGSGYVNSNLVRVVCARWRQILSLQGPFSSETAYGHDMAFTKMSDCTRSAVSTSGDVCRCNLILPGSRIWLVSDLVRVDFG